MSKRTDAIRSLFIGTPDAALSADNKAPPRVSSGAVRSLRGTFSDAERENDQLRRQLAAGIHIIDVEPNLIDPSPVADRFEERDPSAFEALKLSIFQRGQEVPVLLREHPDAPGRFQSAYGHRRVRAARELGRPVRAVVRTMTEEDLVVAQGVENSAREDLSFIERAVFAVRLEEAGHDRAVAQEALSIDRAEVSKLIAVARAIPPDVISWIGKAPKVGRGRWQALADQLKRPSAVTRARSVTETSPVTGSSSDQRFLAVMAGATDKVQKPEEKAATPAVLSIDGQDIARIHRTDRGLNITIDRSKGDGFADFLVEELPRLHDKYVARTSTGRRGA